MKPLSWEFPNLRQIANNKGLMENFETPESLGYLKGGKLSDFLEQMILKAYEGGMKPFIVGDGEYFFGRGAGLNPGTIINAGIFSDVIVIEPCVHTGNENAFELITMNGFLRIDFPEELFQENPQLDLPLG